MPKQLRSQPYTQMQKAIGERIAWARELVIPSQRDCAELTGVHPATLNKIEKGTRAPTIFLIVELSNRLRVSTDFLLKGVLNGRTDHEIALLLAAKHPELVLQHTSTVHGMDTDQTSGKQMMPKKPDPHPQ